MQANSAGYEISNIDEQILAAYIRVNMADPDLQELQEQINKGMQSYTLG